MSRLAPLMALVAALVPVAAVYSQSPPRPKLAPTPGEWMMYGGTPARNMVNLRDKLPQSWAKAPDWEDAAAVKKWEAEHVRWKATLGSRSYSQPVVAGGKVFVGTNNENPRNKRDRAKPTEDDPDGPPIDKGVLMCFDAATGKFLWQAVHDKLESGIVNDFTREGMCAIPTVVGDRVYYVSNQCRVVCLDVNGFADGNQGVRTEKYKGATDADFIWEYDMMRELKVFPHNMSTGCPLIVGDLLFVPTSNGVDENHVNVANPTAPSFLCLNRLTGKLVWADDSPGYDIMHGQWASPAYTADPVPQVIFPGGDGWLRAFDPPTGKLLWKFDCNPKDSKYELGGKGTRSDFIGAPVIYDGKVYIGTGQDPEHFEGIGHFWCIDLTNKRGDVSPDLVTDAKKVPPAIKPNPNSAMVWHYGGEEKRPFAKRDYVFGRTMSSACVVGGIVYITELAGYLHCLDAKTGKFFWQYDTKSSIWSSPYYVDGKVLVTNEDGDLYVFKHEKGPAVIDEVAEGSVAAVAAVLKSRLSGRNAIDARKAGRDANDDAIKVTRDTVKAKLLLAHVELNQCIRGTPSVAGGVLYIATEKTLFAFGKP